MAALNIFNNAFFFAIQRNDFWDMNKLPFVSTWTNYIWWFFAIESRFNSQWLPSHNLFNVTLTLDASTSHYIRKARNAQQQFFNAAIWLIEIVGEKQSVAVQTLIYYMRLCPINKKSPVMSKRLIITIILIYFLLIFSAFLLEKVTRSRFATSHVQHFIISIWKWMLCMFLFIQSIRSTPLI